MDVEAIYWKLRDADGETLNKEIDRLIKEGHGKELTIAVSRLIVNLHSKIDVFERECNLLERDLGLAEDRNRKLHKVVNEVRKVIDKAPSEESDY